MLSQFLVNSAKKIYKKNKFRNKDFILHHLIFHADLFLTICFVYVQITKDTTSGGPTSLMIIM